MLLSRRTYLGAARAVSVAMALLLPGLPLSAPAQPAGEFHPTIPARGKPGKARIAGLDLDSIVVPIGFFEALDGLDAEANRARRGAVEAAIFRSVSPSVVKVVTKDGLGSGTVITPQQLILTCAHVVGGAKKVGIVFRPPAGASSKDAKVYSAEVLRIDEVADLALIRLSEPLPATAMPVPIAAAGVSVGDDVHAIGHPLGEEWTYTKGYVSQVRTGYKWQNKEGVMHTADVVQTQTPINPGNSGGPLLNNAGAIVGVNSFGFDGGQALNFAISVKDVNALLARTTNRVAKRQQPACRSKVVFEGRTSADDGDFVEIDLDCDGVSDLRAVRPDTPSAPIYALITDGKAIGDVRDLNRDGKWDVSFWDVNGDGTSDLVGHHPDGNLMPSSYSKFPG